MRNAFATVGLLSAARMAGRPRRVFGEEMTRLEEIKARAEAEDVKFLLAHLDRAISLLKAQEYSADFCDGPACVDCMNAPWQPHSSECRLKQFLDEVSK